MKKILITGANGFIGAEFIKIASTFFHIVAPVRHHIRPINNVDYIFISNLDDILNESYFKDVDCVIHLAAIAHNSKNCYDKLLDVNSSFAVNLADFCKLMKVKKFIFVSTIGVNGNYSISPFRSSDEPSPHDFYSFSKLEAEIGIKRVLSESDVDYILLRPPLIYGRNASGTFRQLTSLLKLGLPLPFGSLSSLRSFIFVGNFVDLLVYCVNYKEKVNGVILCSDGQDITISNFFQKIIFFSKAKTLIFPFSNVILSFIFSLFGKREIYRKISVPLQVVNEASISLDWKPLYSVDEALQTTFKEKQ